LTDADSEQFETQHWLEIAYECKYIDKLKLELMIGTCESIGKMLNSMIEKASSFCKQKNY
jgi:four helix bundle protein